MDEGQLEILKHILDAIGTQHKAAEQLISALESQAKAIDKLHEWVKQLASAIIDQERRLRNAELHTTQFRT